MLSSIPPKLHIILRVKSANIFNRKKVWYASFVDTLAPSHLSATSVRGGAASEVAEASKQHKYGSTSAVYVFAPTAVETMVRGVLTSQNFLKTYFITEIIITTGNKRVGSILAQRLSIIKEFNGNACLVPWLAEKV